MKGYVAIMCCNVNLVVYSMQLLKTSPIQVSRGRGKATSARALNELLQNEPFKKDTF